MTSPRGSILSCTLGDADSDRSRCSSTIPPIAASLPRYDARCLRRDAEGELRERVAEGLASRRGGIAEDGVAFSGEAFVELDDRTRDARTAAAQFLERVQQVVLGADVFGAFGKGHPGFPKNLPASRLRAETGKSRIHAVQRNAQEHRQLSLERGRVEHGQERPGGVGDTVADALDQAGPFEDLLRQRAGRRVMGAQERQPRARMARRDPGQQLEVVLENERMDREGGDVHHPGLGITEADQQKQEALFVEGRAVELGELGLIQRERGDHDGGVRLLLARREGAPESLELRLQPLELGDFERLREVAGKRRFRDQSASLTTQFRPAALPA